MNTRFPEITRLLVIAPHPDDEALGCAGTVRLLNREGVLTTLVFLTDGERLLGEPSREIADKRRAEGLNASGMLGCSETLFLGFPDGALADHAEDMSRRLSEIIVTRNPDMVFSPSPVDYHPDHIAASRIALKLLNDFRTFKLAFYEVYSTLRFNYLIDITDVADLKKQTILTYHTSLYGNPERYVHAALGLNAQRSLFVQKEGYYEAFYVVEKGADLAGICDHLTYKDFPG